MWHVGILKAFYRDNLRSIFDENSDLNMSQNMNCRDKRSKVSKFGKFCEVNFVIYMVIIIGHICVIYRGVLTKILKKVVIDTF